MHGLPGRKFWSPLWPMVAGLAVGLFAWWLLGLTGLVEQPRAVLSVALGAIGMVWWARALGVSAAALWLWPFVTPPPEDERRPPSGRS